MKIYDRYKLDSSEERQRQTDGIAKARRGIREDYDRLNNLSVALFVIFFGLVIALGIWGDALPSDAVWVLAGLAGLFLIAAFTGYYLVYGKSGDDKQADLYIFGMENGDFLMLNPLYEEMERIAPGDICEIRILAAMRPTTRQRYIHRRRHGINRKYGDRTHYEYFGDTVDAGGYAQTTPYPMAVLCTGGKEFDWRWIDDPIFRRDLQQWITFVPFGENADPFAYLLENTTCPVVIVREVYEQYRDELDGLFAQSGMNMNRLQFMQEESRQVEMTTIIG